MADTQTSDGTRFKQDLHDVGRSVDTLKADVGHLVRGTVDAAHSGTAELRQGARHAVDMARDKLDGAREMVRNKYEGAKATGADAADSVRGVITRHPIASVGMAAGAGILIGLLLRRPGSRG